MVKSKLTKLFKEYKAAFLDYNIENVRQCYHFPCTLNTPDKAVLLSNQSDFIQEFSAIFTQLKEARTCDLVAKKSSFEQVSNDIYLVCIDWEFIDKQEEVFANFSAIYHVLNDKDSLKIINVNSHELESSLALAEPFDC